LPEISVVTVTPHSEGRPYCGWVIFLIDLYGGLINSIVVPVACIRWCYRLWLSVCLAAGRKTAAGGKSTFVFGRGKLSVVLGKEEGENGERRNDINLINCTLHAVGEQEPPIQTCGSINWKILIRWRLKIHDRIATGIYNRLFFFSHLWKFSARDSYLFRVFSLLTYLLVLLLVRYCWLAECRVHDTDVTAFSIFRHLS